jgi:lipoprotein-releasing system ATP-binding protein
MSEPVLVGEDLHKIYKGPVEELWVLRGISLTMKPADFVFITGPSGTGKSTLLHILGGLDKPTRGRVYLDSVELFGHPDRQIDILRNRNVGFVFQFHYLLPEFTCLENVAMPMLIAGRPKKEALERSMRLLTEVGLEHRTAHKPEELSGGERQKVQVARALVNEPRVVLADEPTGSLDSKSSASLIDLMVRLNETRSMTFLLVTHNESLTGFGIKYKLVDGRLEE